MAKEENPMRFWLYDLLLWILSIGVDLFFREIHPRSSWKVPKTGPLLIVAAPHANQFIDPLILMRVLRLESHRRVSWLIAEKSIKRAFIGTMAKMYGAVTVGRALDSTTSAEGKIYLPDPDNDPTLVRGVGTNFQDSHFQVGGLLVLPSVNNTAANSEIAEIISAEELRVKKPFTGAVAMKQLTGRDNTSAEGNGVDADQEKQINAAKDHQGTSFKVAPKVDQTEVYNQVFKRLSAGGCVGIFPEGGSHDRTELLPLKAGVAIMALGAVAEDPNCNIRIVPCGMNYFNAHKFRSRAVVEFGTALEVPPKLVEQYKNGHRREAIGAMLDMIYNALLTVTVTSPDYDTLMLIQAVRRLYNPKGKKLPLPVVVELNRRLVKGYTHYKDDPRILALRKGVMRYNKELLALNIRDHQVEYAKLSMFTVLATLFYRIGKIVVLGAGTLPGLVLFAPVFVAGKLISMQKAREALAASSVKIQARDVVATWKMLVAMALAPTLYTLYTILLTWWTYYNRVQGLVPSDVPLWAVVLFGYIFFPAITFAALRFGEIGLDIIKSLRPLTLSLYPFSDNTLVRLRTKREMLATEVTNLINELGPELFPDFESTRLISPTSPTSEDPPDTLSRGRSWGDLFSIRSRDSSPDHFDTKGASIGGGSSFAGALPRNESFKNLANIGLFASRPQTPTSPKSRSQSGTRPGSSSGPFGGLHGFSSLDSKGAMDDVSKKIRGAMRERGQRRADEEDDEEDSPDEHEDEETNGLSIKKNL